MTIEELIDEELIDALLYENEPPKPQKPWENLNTEERAHYRNFARNLLAHLHEVGLTMTRVRACSTCEHDRDMHRIDGPHGVRYSIGCGASLCACNGFADR
jgi:hypothetical protein